MTKPSIRFKDIQKPTFKSKASFKTQTKNVFKTNGACEVNRLKIARNLNVKKKIKDKRDAKNQQKTLIKVENETRRQKALKEKTDTIRQLKKNRLERTKIISKKTNRGQPLMKDRIQYLLNKIQEMKRC